jgi:plasmid stabilization system protein ParE
VVRGPHAGLGAEFLRALEAAISAIRRRPTSYPEVFGASRRAVLRRFPYSLIYIESGDDILIVACIHGRRDPRRWQKRL